MDYHGIPAILCTGLGHQGLDPLRCCRLRCNREQGSDPVPHRKRKICELRMWDVVRWSDDLGILYPLVMTNIAMENPLSMEVSSWENHLWMERQRICDKVTFLPGILRTFVGNMAQIRQNVVPNLQEIVFEISGVDVNTDLDQFQMLDHLQCQYQAGSFTVIHQIFQLPTIQFIRYSKDIFSDFINFLQPKSLDPGRPRHPLRSGVPSGTLDGVGGLERVCLLPCRPHWTPGARCYGCHVSRRKVGVEGGVTVLPSPVMSKQRTGKIHQNSSGNLAIRNGGSFQFATWVSTRG